MTILLPTKSKTANSLLPLMHYYEYLDICFLVHVSYLKESNPNYPISDLSPLPPRIHVQNLLQNCLQTKQSQTYVYIYIYISRQFYFNRVTRLWTFLPPIDLDLLLASIKCNLKQISWKHFKQNFSWSKYCTFHSLCPCNSSSSSSAWQLLVLSSTRSTPSQKLSGLNHKMVYILLSFAML